MTVLIVFLSFCAGLLVMGLCVRGALTRAYRRGRLEGIADFSRRADRENAIICRSCKAERAATKGIK